MVSAFVDEVDLGHIQYRRMRLNIRGTPPDANPNIPSEALEERMTTPEFRETTLSDAMARASYSLRSPSYLPQGASLASVLIREPRASLARGKVPIVEVFLTYHPQLIRIEQCNLDGILSLSGFGTGQAVRDTLHRLSTVQIGQIEGGVIWLERDIAPVGEPGADSRAKLLWEESNLLLSVSGPVDLFDDLIAIAQGLSS